MSEPAPLAVPIAWVHPRRCLIRLPLQRGEARRYPMPGCASRLFMVGFACPGCGAVSTWLARKPGAPDIDEGRLVEVRPPVDDEADRTEDRTLEVWSHPITITTTRIETCPGCSRGLTIRDGALVVGVVRSAPWTPAITPP